MVVMKSKKILVLISTTLIVVLFANIKIIKSKTLGSSEIVSDNEIVNDIQETNICESGKELKKDNNMIKFKI